MRSLQNSFLRGWRLWFLVYLTLLFSSLLFEQFSKPQRSNALEYISEVPNSETILIFADLEQESDEFSSIISELTTTNTILKVDYLSLAKDMNNPSAQSYAERILSIIGTYESDSLHIIANASVPLSLLIS